MGGCSLSTWLDLAKLKDVDALDALDALGKVGDGGTFLFTHQRDFGFLHWYPEGVYRPDHSGAWSDGSHANVLDFCC